jgi:predicted acylesterase/phospholipase RssA
MRCVTYIGALMQLRDEGYEFATVSTASAGTLIGALHCSGVAPETMREAVLDMNLARMAGNARFRPLKRLWTLRSWPYALYSDPGIVGAFSEIAKSAGRAPNPTLSDLAVPLSTAAVDVAGKRMLVYSTAQHPDMRVGELLRIAVGIPLMYRPHERQGREVLDVSLASDAPVWLAAGQPEDLPIIVLRTAGPRVRSRRLGSWLADVVQSAVVSRDTFELERLPRVTVHDIQSDVESFAFDLSRTDVSKLVDLGRRVVAEAGERRSQRFVGPSEGPEGRAERQAGGLYSRHLDRLAHERKSTVFLSYAHEDAQWVSALRAQLNALLADPRVELWDDSYITPGAVWLGAIEDAIERARVGVLFVSEHFHGSDFIRERELALLRKAYAGGGLRLLWLSIDGTQPPEPERAIQALVSPAHPLTALSEVEASAALSSAARAIEEAYRSVAASA